MRYAELKYTDAELEQDAIHYLKTQVYAPAYADKLKEFMAEYLQDFKAYYDTDEYAFHNIYFDEYVDGYKDGDVVTPIVDYARLTKELEDDFERLDMTEDEVEKYCFALEAEFKKNAYCSHMEPYFLGYEAVFATVFAGFSRNPLFSIYSMVREWGMALQFQKMYPELMKKFGYRYQYIKENTTGEERLRLLLEYRSKYKLTFQNIGVLRAVHSSVFAYVFMFLHALLNGETSQITDFILDNSSAQLYMLLQGEDIQSIDFPIVKYAIKKLKEGRARDLLFGDGRMNWDAIYDFVSECIKDVGGIENLRSIGFEGIAAKTIRSFWNKSANMQKMLKILRRLAMDNSDPIINQLIEMCEYRLGRPTDSNKKKMERFLEESRRILASRAYELTRPRTMPQEFIAAFPSVFLVYFQWHHSFRTIYPKVPQKQVEYEQNQMRKQADDRLKNKIMTVENEQKQKQAEYERNQKRQQDEVKENNKRNDQIGEDKLRLIMNNREKTLTSQNEEVLNRQKNTTQQQTTEKQNSVAANTIAEMAQKQNTL